MAPSSDCEIIHNNICSLPGKDHMMNGTIKSPQNDETQNADSNLRKRSTAAFLSTMTFASQQHVVGRCDCDECGERVVNGMPVIPNAIQQALQDYQRQKLRQGPLRRTQNRQVMLRSQHAAVSIYKWNLPVHADPLLEFGDSHRLVWVRRHPATTVLKQIGTGIVGSSAEQAKRQILDWQAPNVYWVPSRSGKAVGWIHEPATNTNSTDTPGGPIELYVVKVKPEALQAAKNQTKDVVDDTDSTNDTATTDCWSEEVVALCRQLVRQHDASPSNQYQTYQLSSAHAEIIIRACRNAETS